MKKTMKKEQLSISLLITMIARRVFKKIFAECQKNNFSIPQHHILIECLRLGQSCSQEDLVKILLFNKGTISRGVHELERKGFLTIYLNENSNQSVRLTNKGLEYAKENVYASVCGLEGIQKNFTEDQQQILIHYLFEYYSQINPQAKNEVFPETWPKPIHYILNSVKYMEATSELFRKDGREANQLHLLGYLAYMDGQASYKEAEKTLFVAQSVIVRQVKKLVDKGYVESLIDENDKRIKYAILTELGKQKALEVINVFENMEKLGCSNISEKEKIEFRDLLKEMLANIERDLQKDS